jgi:hypothetical protein
MRLASLILLATVTAAVAQQPAQPVAMTYTYPVAVYQIPDVGKTLTLTTDQTTRLNALTEKVQAQYRDNYAKIASLPEADRDARARELYRQYYTDWDKGARDIFNDTQRARYQQIAYQYGGFDTLYYPDVQTRLGLTPAQIKELNDHWAWNNQQWQTVYTTGVADPTKGATLYRDYWTARQARFNKFLTPAQQKAWGELTGEAYVFQPYFGPRRP